MPHINPQFENQEIRTLPLFTDSEYNDEVTNPTIKNLFTMMEMLTDEDSYSILNVSPYDSDEDLIPLALMEAQEEDDTIKQHFYLFEQKTIFHNHIRDDEDDEELEENSEAEIISRHYVTTEDPTAVDEFKAWLHDYQINTALTEDYLIIELYVHSNEDEDMNDPQTRLCWIMQNGNIDLYKGEEYDPKYYNADLARTIRDRLHDILGPDITIGPEEVETIENFLSIEEQEAAEAAAEKEQNQE